MSEPVLTQSMTMYLNGGSKFSELHFDILADGKPTGIKRSRRTNGSPEHLITADLLYLGEDVFDVFKAKGVGMKEWILSRLKTPEAS